MKIGNSETRDPHLELLPLRDRYKAELYFWHFMRRTERKGSLKSRASREEAVLRVGFLRGRVLEISTDYVSICSHVQLGHKSQFLNSINMILDSMPKHLWAPRESQIRSSAKKDIRLSLKLCLQIFQIQCPAHGHVVKSDLRKCGSTCLYSSP